MRILVVGKFPPIQGGTSNQTLTTVTTLADHGHQVHVLTNAGEVELTCRHLDTESDRRTLAALLTTGSGGSVTVHQTTPLGATSYIPWAQPYASKLFGVGVDLVTAHRFDLIVGWYLEPYGLVAAQLAQIAGAPLLLRHAGSDIGRLARHPDLRPAYRWALQRADFIITGPRAGAVLVELGADPGAFVIGSGGSMPDYFSDPYAPLDPAALRGEAIERYRDLELPGRVTDMLVANLERWPTLALGPIIGTYGKVDHSKGSYDLLAALDLLARDGLDFTLLGATGGQQRLLVPFLDAVAEHEHLRERAVLLPFVAPWRVPGFLDACDVVCFLEHDFDVGIHRPRVPLEVLMRGRALVLSDEIAGRQAFGRRLVDGENCARVEDPTDAPGLSRRLGALLANRPAARRIGARGQALAASLPTVTGPDGPAAAIEQALAGILSGGS